MLWRVWAALTRAAAAAARAQVVSDDKDRLTELGAELTAVQMGSPLDPVGLRKEYNEVSARLPGESEEAAGHAELADRGAGARVGPRGADRRRP